MANVEGFAAAELAQQRFGGRTLHVETRPTIDTTVTTLAKGNPRRVFVFAMNRSVNNAAMGFSNELTFANGQLVGANGGYVSLDAEEDGETVAAELKAIQDGAAGAWWVLEVLRK